MGRLKKALFFLVLFVLTSSFSSKQKEPTNFHRVDSKLYRSGQPTKKEMAQLTENGISTILNLRNIIDDKQEIKHTDLVQIRIPIRAKKIDYNDILQSLIAIQNAKGKVLVHCLHGSDRTGCIVAAYQMVFMDWSKEKAITVFQNEKYGYNSKLFPNILTLLQELDVDQLRSDLFEH